MLVQDIEVTLLKVENRSGTGKKSGKPYSFMQATVVDDDANVFGLIFAEDVSTGEFLGLRNKALVVDIEFKPKGFDIGGTITKASLA